MKSNDISSQYTISSNEDISSHARASTASAEGGARDNDVIGVVAPPRVPASSLAAGRRSSREPESRRIGIRIPAAAPEGDLTIRGCDGDETERWERGRVPQRYEVQTFDGLLGLYAEERRADHLYVQLYMAALGTVRGGREIARAPASVLSVLDSNAKKGEESAVKGATLAERVLPFGRVVRGCETITITVAADRRR